MHFHKALFRSKVSLCKLMLFNFIFLVCVAAPGMSSSSPITVEPDLHARLASDGSAGCLIYFGDKVDLSGAAAMTWQPRGERVVQTLQNTAQGAQSRVRDYLDRLGVKYRSYWAANVIAADGVSQTILDGLMGFPEIETITARHTIPLPEPADQDALQGAGPDVVEPNIAHIKADQAWALGYDGTGMVVANIDGGVRYTHQALVGKYLGNLGASFDHNYNWLDPVSGSKIPIDQTDHGTHVMGIILGDGGPGNRIGVAPGARWIACRGCNMQGCPDESLIACGQFMLAPTDLAGEHPDPSKRPHVVNNSWGKEPGATGDKWYWAIVGAWQAAGVYPVFANGNDATGCGMVHTPADYPNVTSVGNIDHTTDLPSDRSNRGPAIYKDVINPLGYPYLKPQVSAPGVKIRSSIASGDDAYNTLSGTSMAAPHVTGLIALMLEAAPCLTYAQAETILMQTATPIPYVSDCGSEGPEGVPNNATGWGVVDALKAVTQVSGLCGAMGALHGVVNSQSGPVAGATVTTESRMTTITDKDGRYEFPHMTAQLHTVSADRFGFYPKSANVSVDGMNASEDFKLKAKGKAVFKGKVTDGSGAGWPLYAAIAVFTPGMEQTVHTNPATGAYSLSLLKDTPYTLTVSSPGYGTETMTVESSKSVNSRNFQLKAEPSCSAPGYEGVEVFREDFEGEFPPAGWTAPPSGDHCTGVAAQRLFQDPQFYSRKRLLRPGRRGRPVQQMGRRSRVARNRAARWKSGHPVLRELLFLRPPALRNMAGCNDRQRSDLAYPDRLHPRPRTLAGTGRPLGLRRQSHPAPVALLDERSLVLVLSADRQRQSDHRLPSETGRPPRRLRPRRRNREGPGEYRGSKRHVGDGDDGRPGRLCSIHRKRRPQRHGQPCVPVRLRRPDPQGACQNGQGNSEELCASPQVGAKAAFV